MRLVAPLLYPLLQLTSIQLTSANEYVPAGAPSRLAAMAVNEELTAQRSDGREYVVKRLAGRPAAFLMQGYLSAAECSQLISGALSSGMVAAETTGNTDARRRCDLALLSPSQHQALRGVQSDAARLLLSEQAMADPGGGCEPLHVLRYRENGEYLAHYDAMNHPRLITCLFYLNGVGATWFPIADSAAGDSFADHGGAVAYAAALDPTKDGLRVSPSKGDAIAFFNFDAEGQPDPWALHAGCQVQQGESAKWIGTLWFDVPGLCTT